MTKQVSIDPAEKLAKQILQDALLKLAFRGTGSSTSLTRDHEGRLWLWAGYIEDPQPGDGTRECEILAEMGVLGEDEPENGFHAYPLTELGERVRRVLNSYP